MRLPCALSIAGSDPTGAAGLQADLRTFAALKVQGLGAVAAVTAQNSRRVIATQPVAANMLRDQLNALAEDFPIAAIKIGLLASASNIAVVAAFLGAGGLHNIVLDPVLVSSSGTVLLPAKAQRALIDLLPQMDIVTPNRPEAAALLGRPLPAKRAARALLDLGARAVLLKGGHARGTTVVDYFADGNGVRDIRHPRLPFDARGTGCVLSSAIAAYLARGYAMGAAVDSAEQFLQRALRRSRRAGHSAKHFLLLNSDNE
ncbi:MAG TPA: bifunctional hydroxymethylpyrimidine kinase/phosphomethylpyrimidine kinase [Rudaea sp.]|nr:bifunctional hydroxymethylpyrimidine kinase/phosphomethylpyrimidine kinase [Rudaea sp.]